MTTNVRTPTEAALVAKLARTQLKAAGIPARVTSKNYSGGDSVRVTLYNPLPATKEAVEIGLRQYQGGYFDGSQDLYVYQSRKGPSVRFLFVDAEYSEDLQQEAWEYLCGYLVGFEDAPVSVAQAGSFRNVQACDYGDRLLYRVLTGDLGHFWSTRKPRITLPA